ncbi:ATP-binding protein [Thermogemmatispora sp.]|uniref:GAF domain-containing sensor histidine kinase n=1 Tax=Thermogemmatispora sp. TaxID=1968838 RepID=UPI001D3CC4D9|nr:ATP-binding protein [Thermogemmatispora sp.]MBX5451413.1 GAF domain-containing protein [Thermogemmatispora sp.]
MKQRSARQQESSLEQQQRELLRHIIDIGASLRLGMDTDTLLQRVSEAACKALRFRYSALYLSNGAGFFEARASAGLSPEQHRYLIEHPLPEEAVNKLICERYRIGNSYFIPKGDPIWRDATLASFFIIVDDRVEAVPLDSTPLSEPDLGPEWHVEDLLIVPLRGADNSLLGFLTPDSPLNGLRPTQEILELFELFANQAAIVIEGTRLYEELKRHSEERAALVKIGRALSAPEDPGDLQSIYQTIYEQVAPMMPVDAFYIARYVRTAEGEKLVMEFLIDDGVKYPAVEFGLILPQTHNILFHEPVGRLITTSREFLEFAGLTNGEEGTNLLGSNRPAESILFVPLRYGEKVLGLLSVQSYRPHAYTQRHLELLKEIGIQAAIAMNNAQLYTELREALKQAQESERLKNHFLMTASHELRTPLTAIQGYLELLGDFGESLDEEAKARFISNARRACEELVLLLGNVMDASRIDQDRVLLKMEPVQVIRPVMLILEILEPILVREERRMHIEVPEDLQVWADDLRLRQILLNIVGNALKYTPAGSPVAISARRLSWEELCCLPSLADQHRPAKPPSGFFALMAVRDWGPGISRADQARLFTRFMRLPNALNSMQRGAGLGLYLCRQLTEAMGGSIWLESEGIPGEGSTFYIALPLYSEEQHNKE